MLGTIMNGLRTGRALGDSLLCLFGVSVVCVKTRIVADVRNTVCALSRQGRRRVRGRSRSFLIVDLWMGSVRMLRSAVDDGLGVAVRRGEVSGLGAVDRSFGRHDVSW